MTLMSNEDMIRRGDAHDYKMECSPTATEIGEPA